MPLAPLTICKEMGCNQLTRDPIGYCELHTQPSRHTEYSRNRTDKRETSFYNSKAWKQVRAMVLGRDLGLCQHCIRDGRTDKIPIAEVVHHIVSIKTDWSLRLVMTNLTCLCNSCHTRVHRPRGHGVTEKVYHAPRH